MPWHSFQKKHDDFFCSVGKDLADEINSTSNPLLVGDYEIYKRKTKLHFMTTEVQKIRGALAKVKAAKSFGTDYISSYILRLALAVIENLLAFMLNTTIETSLLKILMTGTLKLISVFL